MTASSPPPLSAGRRSLTWLWTALGLAGALGAAMAVALPRRSAPPVLGTLPDFALVERSGRGLRRADLEGRPWLADFVFTRCAGVCPAMTGRMARLRRQIPSAVPFVSFTVDPRHDTPEVLRRYADAAGAGADWFFVTGEQAALYRLAREGFRLAAEEVPPGQPPEGDGPFLHSSKFVLVDAASRLRGYYDSTDEAALSALRRDLDSVRDGR